MLDAVDFTDDIAPQAFVASLLETGFGVLKNHPLSSQTLTELYQHWQLFFDDEQKYQFLFDPEQQDGFFSTDISETAKGQQLKDLKEYFHYYPNGRCPQHLQRKTHEYYQQSSELARTLLGWIEQQAPAEVNARFSEPLGDMIKGSDQTLLRILHYPALNGNESPGAIRAAAHQDINLITLLPAATSSGLQVKLNDGSWLDVPCDSGYLIINIGDMLQEASGGYFPSTTHRVVNPTGAANQGRISMPLFLHPRPDVVLSSRYTADSYLNERLSELGVKHSK